MNTLPVVCIAVASENLKRVEKEYKTLKDLFSPLADQGVIRLVAEPFASVQDIRNVFKKYPGQVRLFHFAGHSDGEFLYVNDEEFPLINLKPFIRSLGKEKGLEYVFLNCCNSGKLWKELISSNLKRFIVTNEKVDDTLAWIYASTFYEAFLKGSNIREALDQANDEVDIRFSGRGVQRGFELGKEMEEDFPSSWWQYHGPGGEEY